MTGEVELTETGTTAELREHVPSGLDPKILLLDLVIHQATGHIAWFEADLQDEISGNAYGGVDILHGGNVVQRVKVEHP